MKRYKVISVLYATSFKNAAKSINNAEIVNIYLDDEEDKPENKKIGF